MERIEEARNDYPEIIEELERLKRVVDQIFELTDIRIGAEYSHGPYNPIYYWCDATWEDHVTRVDPKYQDLNEEIERR